ncbi:hypothetical protein J8273_3582 [Carpediemonas membranifera]|uniref:Uncharacterized protein n=1 Tax=Carpediemonas membranifera TaxID=201153 RepID=A0A8J6E1G4_9EUKA|nr:hypothetical protein J8273_3582 [Carpediemonas membranifera]|eukprot:KAG9393443.1 hypothetical protein J8273_3582 [Carpediemonas membranifera]
MDLGFTTANLLEPAHRGVVLECAAVSSRLDAVFELHSQISPLNNRLKKTCPSQDAYLTFNDYEYLRMYYSYQFTPSGVITISLADKSSYSILETENAVIMSYACTMPVSTDTVSFHTMSVSSSAATFACRHIIPVDECLTAMELAVEISRPLVICGTGDGGALAQLSFAHAFAMLLDYPGSALDHTVALTNQDRKRIARLRKSYLAKTRPPKMMCVTFGATPVFEPGQKLPAAPGGLVPSPLAVHWHNFFNPSDYEAGLAGSDVPAVYMSSFTVPGSLYIIHAPPSPEYVDLVSTLAEQAAEAAQPKSNPIPPAAWGQTAQLRFCEDTGLFHAVVTKAEKPLFLALHEKWADERVDPTVAELGCRAALIDRLLAARVMPFEPRVVVESTESIDTIGTASSLIKPKLTFSNVELACSAIVSGSIHGVYSLTTAVTFLDIQTYVRSLAGYAPLAPALAPASKCGVSFTGASTALYLNPFLKFFGPLGGPAPILPVGLLSFRVILRNFVSGKTRSSSNEMMKGSMKQAVAWGAIGGVAYGPPGALLGGLWGSFKGSKKVKKEFDRSRQGR